MTDLMTEILDFQWVRKGITGKARSASITKELGAVGDADITLPIGDPIVDVLPDPDAANPYEGRFKIYEDDIVKFAGVIDATSVTMNESDATISFSGKHRGIELGFYNTGRVDYLGWPVDRLFRELLRNNIAKKATVESVSSEDELYPAYSALTGDPYKANYWKSEDASTPHELVIDLGDDYDINAVRVMPQWWKDRDTKRFHYHKFTVGVSSDNVSYTTIGSKVSNNPSSGYGHLYESNNNCRYVKLTVTESSDGFARIAQVMIYQDIADIGSDTTFVTPFIENDDSGNVTRSGDTSRPVVAGAFQGDSVITKSFVTQLDSGSASVTQTFRGVSSAVFFTSARAGVSHVNIYVDNVLRVSNLEIPNRRWWFKGYDTIEDVGLLSDAQHTLKVERVDGTPRIDYFNGLYRTSWRPIEDDDPSIGYVGSWSAVEAPYYHNYFSAKGKSGDEMKFEFKGDRIRVKGSKVDDGGTFRAYIDGNLEATVDTSGAGQHKQVLFEWSGSYGDHDLRLEVASGPVYIDRLEGNFIHTLYIRSRYETNLKVLTRLSEILDSYLRFNDDGSVDLLGSVGEPTGFILREGENEGGNLINVSKEHEYSETGSVCLALVNVNGELPIKAMVIDHEALEEIGWKVIKLENSDAADQFLLNRQALTFLRDHRKPQRSYNMSYEGEEIPVGLTARVYAPTADLDGSYHRIGKITTDYESE